MSLSPFFNPRSVAVIGASSKPGKSGHILLQNMLNLGFKGTVYPINPNADIILGSKCYPTILDCPETPELSVIAVPRELVPQAMQQSANRGSRHAIIATGGFTDTNDKLGLALDEEIRQIAAEADMNYMGPNSIGTIDTHSRFITSITPNEPLPAGPVSFFGQTGLFASGYTRWLTHAEPFGVAKIACLGNKNNVDEADLLRFLADDEQTGVIGCYLEGANDGRGFFNAAKKVARHKPLVVVKGGTSKLGGVAAAGHTGSMAGDQAIFKGVLKQAGAFAAADLEDMFDLLAGFAHGPLPQGRRLGVISITGAGCVLAADAADRSGLSLPELSPHTISRIRRVCPDWAPIRNPVDVWSSIEQIGVEKAYEEIGLAVSQDPNIDMIVLAITLFEGTIFDIGPIVAAIKEASPDKTIATVLLGGGPLENRDWTIAAHRAGAATFPSLRRAVRALSTMADYAARPVKE